MALRIEHPRGEVPIPREWCETGRVSRDDLQRWLESNGLENGKASGSRGGKRNSRKGIREDLGHYCRSSMEANLERYLRFLGHRPWLEKTDPPREGRWYRYEGRRWDFTDRKGDPIKTSTGFYLADFEVWPGVVDCSRAYEVLEVKGWMDGSSKTKLNRMRKQYPEVPVEVISSKEFDRMTKGARHHIPGWE